MKEDKSNVKNRCLSKGFFGGSLCLATDAASVKVSSSPYSLPQDLLDGDSLFSVSPRVLLPLASNRTNRRHRGRGIFLLSVVQPNDEKPVALAPRSRFASLRDGASGFLDFMTNPWFTFLCLFGLVIGILMPPIGLTRPNCTMLVWAGVPCPSCGLTRSTSAVLQGEFYGAWLYNPFGYVVAVLFALLGPLTLLPRSWRKRLRQWLRPAEVYLAILFIALALSLSTYGLVRIVQVYRGADSVSWWRTGGTPPYMVEHHGPAPERTSLFTMPELFGGEADVSDAAEPLSTLEEATSNTQAEE